MSHSAKVIGCSNPTATAMASEQGSRSDSVLAALRAATSEAHAELAAHLRLVMRRYRASTIHRTPAIALTAFTRPSDRTSALQAGFQAHVPKPVDADELVATIVSLLGAPSSST